MCTILKYESHINIHILSLHPSLSPSLSVPASVLSALPVSLPLPCLSPSSLSVSLYVLAVVYEQFCNVCVTRLNSRIEGPVTVLRGGGTGVEGE